MADASHMAHLPAFLSEVGRHCDVHVVIQRGDVAPAVPNARSVHVLRSGSHLLRTVDLLRVAAGLRRQGCRKFFVRISSTAAVPLALAASVLDLEVFFWRSGQGREVRLPGRDGLRRRARFWMGDALLRATIRSVQHFVTGPERMVEYFAREYGADPSRTIVLYNDIDPGVFAPVADPGERLRLRERLRLPVDRPVVLSVGGVTPNYGGQFLLPIARQLRELAPDALFVVVGPVGMPRVEDEARAEGGDNLRFAGPLPNTEVLRHLQAADLFLMPSAAEGFPRKLLEAMACGLPFVAFDVGGVRDIVPPEWEGECVVPPGDVEAMAGRTAELLRDPERMRALAASARARVERFSTPNVAQMFVERIVHG